MSVLISNELWRRRYSADPQMVGRTISIDGVAHQVVGVLPASFHFPKLSDLYPLTIVQDSPQIWKPIALRPEELTLSGGFQLRVDWATQSRCFRQTGCLRARCSSEGFLRSDAESAGT